MLVGLASGNTLAALLRKTIPYSGQYVQICLPCCGLGSDRLVYIVSLKKFFKLDKSYTTLYPLLMKRYYIYFKISPQAVPLTNKPNSPWKLFWAGEDAEMAWRNYGLFHRDSPIRVYRERKVQLRTITFKARPPVIPGEKPEDYDFEGTR